MEVGPCLIKHIRKGGGKGERGEKSSIYMIYVVTASKFPTVFSHYVY